MGGWRRDRSQLFGIGTVVARRGYSRLSSVEIIQSQLWLAFVAK